ncbi:MAG: DUF4286 family protein [Bacteroidia bacterium]|nr:DUF4286 family protein [Bacteroidia bacterium]MCX7651543.1 DUF4286 family protein [Bacteroidia bacterium]MDW8416261.1 DUF4286 family protein [Bacteroidia bacterium]
MLIYAVKVEIEAAIAEAWRMWMVHTHISEVLQTGWFRGHRFGEIVEPSPSPGKRVFLVLYEAADYDALKQYLEREAPRLRAAYPPEFQGRFQAERWIWQMT